MQIKIKVMITLKWSFWLTDLDVDWEGGTFRELALLLIVKMELDIEPTDTVDSFQSLFAHE